MTGKTVGHPFHNRRMKYACIKITKYTVPSVRLVVTSNFFNLLSEKKCLLTVKQLADKVKLAPGHLSDLLKKEFRNLN